MPDGVMIVDEDEWPKTLSQFLMPLTKDFKVEFDRSLVSEVKDGEPDVKLYLHEKGEYLVFQPIFSYKGYDTKASDKNELIIPHHDKVIVVYRNRAAEKDFIDLVKFPDTAVFFFQLNSKLFFIAVFIQFINHT